jgi:hypothetical protein
VDLGVIAAFTAAGLSLVNVVYSARAAHRGDRERWRREQERPVVARSLALSRELGRERWDAVAAKGGIGTSPGAEAELSDSLRKAWQLIGDLHFEVAQLDLLASPAVREAAGNLIAAHKEEAKNLARPRGTDTYEEICEARQATQNTIEQLEKALIDMARTDLGLRSAPLARPRSLLGRLVGKK